MKMCIARLAGKRRAPLLLPFVSLARSLASDTMPLAISQQRSGGATFSASASRNAGRTGAHEQTAFTQLGSNQIAC